MAKRSVGSFWGTSEELLTTRVARLLRLVDAPVDPLAFHVDDLVELTGDLVRFFTTGTVRNYALSFTLGVLALAIYVFLR